MTSNWPIPGALSSFASGLLGLALEAHRPKEDRQFFAAWLSGEHGTPPPFEWGGHKRMVDTQKKMDEHGLFHVVPNVVALKLIMNHLAMFGRSKGRNDEQQWRRSTAFSQRKHRSQGRWHPAHCRPGARLSLPGLKCGTDTCGSGLCIGDAHLELCA